MNKFYLITAILLMLGNNIYGAQAANLKDKLTIKPLIFDDKKNAERITQVQIGDKVCKKILKFDPTKYKRNCCRDISYDLVNIDDAYSHIYKMIIDKFEQQIIAQITILGRAFRHYLDWENKWSFFMLSDDELKEIDEQKPTDKILFLDFSVKPGCAEGQFGQKIIEVKFLHFYVQKVITFAQENYEFGNVEVTYESNIKDPKLKKFLLNKLRCYEEGQLIMCLSKKDLADNWIEYSRNQEI